MGGVDIADQVLSYYRNKSHTAKYTVRAMLHMFDMACSNLWLEYQRDCTKANKKPMDSMEFNLQLADSLIGGNCSASSEGAVSLGEEEGEESLKRKGPRPIPNVETHTTGACHMPQVSPAYAIRKRCRYSGCSEKTRFSCRTCKVFLCLANNRDCYFLFHQP